MYFMENHLFYLTGNCFYPLKIDKKCRVICCFWTIKAEIDAYLLPYFPMLLLRHLSMFIISLYFQPGAKPSPRILGRMTLFMQMVFSACTRIGKTFLTLITLF